MDPDPIGFFAPESVHTAFSWVGFASIGVVILLVSAAYLATSGSLSPRFVRRWWGLLALAALLCFVIAAGVLFLYPTHAMADSCHTNPTEFLATLPSSIVWKRAFAGLIWGALAFFLFSVALTRSLGRWPWSAGFFHHRGCPVPRFLP
jgi:hypothetical protein